METPIEHQEAKHVEGKADKKQTERSEQPKKGLNEAKTQQVEELIQVQAQNKKVDSKPAKVKSNKPKKNV